MKTVDEFMDQYEGIQRQWIETFVAYMRKHYSEIEEVISYGIPTYKFDKMYIAFSLAKTHFTFHTLDFEMIEMMKDWLPRAKFGKGSAKVKYDDKEAETVLFDCIGRIVERNEKL